MTMTMARPTLSPEDLEDLRASLRVHDRDLLAAAPMFDPDAMLEVAPPGPLGASGAFGGPVRTPLVGAFHPLASAARIQAYTHRLSVPCELGWRGDLLVGFVALAPGTLIVSVGACVVLERAMAAGEFAYAVNDRHVLPLGNACMIDVHVLFVKKSRVDLCGTHAASVLAVGAALVDADLRSRFLGTRALRCGRWVAGAGRVRPWKPPGERRGEGEGEGEGRSEGERRSEGEGEDEGEGRSEGEGEEVPVLPDMRS